MISRQQKQGPKGWPSTLMRPMRPQNNMVTDMIGHGARYCLLAVSIAAFLPFKVGAQEMGEMVGLPVTDQGTEVIATISGRLAYGADRGAIAGLDLTTDQLFGRNQSLRFSGEVSEVDSRLSFVYEAPEMLGDNPVFGLRAFRTEVNRGGAFSFSTVNYGAEPFLRWKLGETTDLDTALALSHDRVSDLEAGGSDILRADLGGRDRATLKLALSHGLKMHAGLWDMGGRLRLEQSFMITSDDSRHLLSQAEAAVQGTNPAGNLRLLATLKAGTLHSVSGTTSVGNRFFYGQSLLRGFGTGGLGPVDEAVPGDPALGGNSYAGAQFEIQFPGAFPGNTRLTPGMHVGAASIFGLDSVAGGGDGSSTVDDGVKWRSSIGLSLNYETQFGQLGLYYSEPISSEPYDRVEEFQIVFGTRF